MNRVLVELRIFFSALSLHLTTTKIIIIPVFHTGECILRLGLSPEGRVMGISRVHTRQKLRPVYIISRRYQIIFC